MKSDLREDVRFVEKINFLELTSIEMLLPLSFKTPPLYEVRWSLIWVKTSLGSSLKDAIFNGNNNLNVTVGTVTGSTVTSADESKKREGGGTEETSGGGLAWLIATTQMFRNNF